MTNGEKLQSIFPNIIKYGNILIDDTGALQKNILFDDSWWNAEYKEPTTTIDYHRAFKIACDLLNGDILYGVDTDKIYELMMQKDGVVSNSSYEEYILNHLQELDQGQYLTENCIACKYDEIEESDGEHCKKCLAGDSQFELDKEFVDQTTKNDLAHNLCDSCTNIGCRFQSGIVRTKCAFYMPPQLEPDNCGNYIVQDSTTKDDLGVDCISRQAVLNLFNKSDEYSWEMSLLKRNIEEMPSVTPQLSSGLEKKTRKTRKEFWRVGLYIKKGSNR